MVRSSLFSIAALLQLVIVLVSGAEFEGSTYWPIYTFNNGTVESDKSCPADEWARLQTAMSAALERDTVMINNSSTEVTNGIRNRLLRQQGQQRQNRHLSCNSCGGKALCLAKAVFMRNGRQVGCATTYGHGRMLTEDGGSSTSSNTNPCSDDIAGVDAAFDELTGEISASCLSLINAPRRIECAKYTRDCDIVGFTVWSYTNGARNNKVLVTHLNATGTSFCKSAGYINI
jgi:hypothetical protein